ncbi:MAG: hypothetical protein ABFD80_08110 [Acidobacteriota bacterium]
MNLFIYMPGQDAKGGELLSAVAPFVSGGCLEVFPDLLDFAARIRRPKDALSIALIWNPARQDLRELGAMRDFLGGVRTLLVLPDEDRETVALAHKIFPAYITYVDDGISEIVSVLKRLTK